MTKPLVPPGLMIALDGALESGTRMRPEHVAGVLDWLHLTIALNVDDHVAMSPDELVLIAHALGDAIGAPIHDINTGHVRDVVATPLDEALRAAAEDAVNNPNNPSRIAYELTRAAFPEGGEQAREAFWHFLAMEKAKLTQTELVETPMPLSPPPYPKEPSLYPRLVPDATSLEIAEDLCPGPGNVHPHHDGPGAPEYYCAACSSQIEEH